MKKQKTLRPTDAADVVGAGAAGGGLGTLIAAFASSLPQTSQYRSLLAISSPLIAVGISGLWLFLKSVYIDPFARQRRHAAIDATMDRIISDARKNAEVVMANPASSQEHKREVQKIVEELETQRLKKITERMEIVAAD